MNSTHWLASHPGKNRRDYVEAMQAADPATKHARYLEALGRDTGYFKWLREEDNGYVVGVWAWVAAPAIFGLILVILR